MICQVDLSELNLDIRAFNAVCRAGFKTAEELFQAMGENQESVRLLVGRSNFDRIDEAFAELEDKGMLEFTTKLPPAPAEETTPEYLEAFNLNARIHYCKDSVERGLAEMCILIEQMRNGKQYKQLHYKTFEDYCQTEFGFSQHQGIKYADVGKMLKSENCNSSYNFEAIGINKLHLLAKLDEPARETVIETVDVENATVKELRNEINRITSENADLGQKLDAAQESLASKDKQFKEAMDAKDRQLKATKESGEQSLEDCKRYLNGRIHELENRIHDMENAPIDHDMTDADAAEEIKRLKRQLEDEQLRFTVLEGDAAAKARRAADEVRHELTQMHEKELQTLKDGYEKQLAEESKKPDRSALDRAKFYALKNVFEEIVDELENLLDELHDDPRIRYINELDNYWTDNLLYLKREGEGAGA